MSTMSKPRRNTPFLPPNDIFLAKKRKVVPHEFVLEPLAALSPWTRPMFGCLAVYIEDKIVLVLRDKPDKPPDNGVWLSTVPVAAGCRELPKAQPSIPDDFNGLLYHRLILSR